MKQGISWFITALKSYAVFGGRTRRKEYWYFLLFSSSITVVLDGSPASNRSGPNPKTAVA